MPETNVSDSPPLSLVFAGAVAPFITRDGRFGTHWRIYNLGASMPAQYITLRSRKIPFGITPYGDIVCIVHHPPEVRTLGALHSAVPTLEALTGGGARGEHVPPGEDTPITWYGMAAVRLTREHKKHARVYIGKYMSLDLPPFTARTDYAARVFVANGFVSIVTTLGRQDPVNG